MEAMYSSIKAALTSFESMIIYVHCTVTSDGENKTKSFLFVSQLQSLEIKNSFLANSDFTHCYNMAMIARQGELIRSKHQQGNGIAMVVTKYIL